MTLAPYDELDVIREKLEAERAEWDPNTKPSQKLVQDTVDDLMYLLILAYVFGKDQACDDLQYEVDADEQKMRDAIYLKIEGRDWVDRVSEHMVHLDVEAVMKVAETEMTRDYNQGGLDSASLIGKKTGRRIEKTWNTMCDPVVRDTHQYLEQVKVGLDEAFHTFDGDSAMAPGGFTLASNNCGCRSWVTFSYG